MELAPDRRVAVFDVQSPDNYLGWMSTGLLGQMNPLAPHFDRYEYNRFVRARRLIL